MTHYKTLYLTLSNSQLNKLKSGIKIGTEVVGDSNDENNFLHKLLLPNTQVSKLRKVFEMVQQLIWNDQKLNCLK